MKHVLVRINKKTVEPSPNLKYDYRIAFRFKRKIDYDESEFVFKEVGDSNMGLGIANDAQFALWLVREVEGHGKYLITVWKKGRRGFSTYYFNCEDTNKFSQIKKRMTAEEQDKETAINKIRRKKNELSKAQTEEDKKEIQEDIENIKEDLGFTEEMINWDDEEQPNRIKLFKNTLPLYKEHGYEEYGGLSPEQRTYDSRIW